MAHMRLEELRAEYPELVDMDERAQIEHLQDGIVNFYGHDLRNPYVALGASGPWIVTTKGAAIHDSGGYGMLGQGHTPAGALEATVKWYVDNPSWWKRVKSGAYREYYQAQYGA